MPTTDQDRPQQETTNSNGRMQGIFRDYAEYDWALETSARILRSVGISSPDDERFAVNTPYNGHYFTVYIGSHVVFQVERPRADDRRVLLLLYANNPAFDAQWQVEEEMTWPEKYINYRLPIAKLQPISDAQWAEIERAARDYVGLHQYLTRSTRRKEHRAELGRIIFDPTQRSTIWNSPPPPPPVSPPVARLLVGYDRQAVRAEIEAAERQREQIIAAFPLGAWPNMPLERYALGTGEQSWCYWLEFGARKLGSIGGGSAHKHQIFKRKGQSGWYFRGPHATVEEAWEELRSAFVALFKHVEAQEWEAAASIPALRSAQMLRVKSSYIYFPDRLLPINSSNHLARYLKLLNAWDDSLAGQDALLLNRALFNRLRAEPALDNWSTLELGFMLWKERQAASDAYLFAWNPDRWRWTANQLDELIDQCWHGDRPDDTWSCGRTQKIEVGDRAFFIRLGVEPRGIFASGTITRAPFPRPHWDDDRAADGKTELGIEFEYDYLIDPERHPDYLIPYNQLKSDERFAKVHWSIQSSGVTLDSEVAAALEAELQKRREMGPPVTGPIYRVDDFCRETHLSPELTADLQALAKQKPQLIFSGPPGTGKTFVATRFARLLTDRADPNNGQIEIVQFHPSYGYEEFIEGIRPESDEKGITYPVVPGVFARFCNRARNDPDCPYIFIIDEINRGNLPRIFGELMLLLEYRDQTVRLPYSQQPFSIPPNVTLIGTMNTADRSIALVDFALRRRFYFVQFPADPDLYDRWHAAQRGLPLYLPALYRKLHAAIDDDHFRIGHSFLMRPSLDDATVARIWRYSIEPQLAEYYFDQPEKVRRWRWDGEEVRAIRQQHGG